jgi:hypothetical protein
VSPSWSLKGNKPRVCIVMSQSCHVHLDLLSWNHGVPPRALGIWHGLVRYCPQPRARAHHYSRLGPCARTRARGRNLQAGRTPEGRRGGRGLTQCRA